MPYARFDDRWDDHKKVKRALRREPIAALMHALAITYCNRHNNNGEIDVEWAEDMFAVMRLKPAHAARVMGTMLDLGMFERRDDDTLLVHDYLDWNLSREQREELADRGRRGGQAKATANGKPGPGNGSSPGSSRGYSNGHSHGSSTPTPTPTPRQEEHPMAAAPPQDEVAQAVDDLCHLMSHHVRVAHGIDPKSEQAKVTKGWRDACRGMLTLDGYTREQIAFAVEWVCRHHYWRNRVKSMTRLRSEMAEVAKQIRSERERGGRALSIVGKESPTDIHRAITGDAA